MEKYLLFFSSIIRALVGIASASCSFEDFTAIIIEEENYRRLKEDIIMIKSQRSDTEKEKLIEECKRIGINKMIRQNICFLNKYNND